MVFDRVDHESVACLLGGKEVNEVVQDDKEASINGVLHMLDQISLCILYTHQNKTKRNESHYLHEMCTLAILKDMYECNFFPHIFGYNLM